MSLRSETVEKIRDYARRYPSAQSAILPALWAVQHEQGYVTPESLAEIASLLELPPSLIESTSSFYSMFLTRPEGRHEVVICVNAPCSLRGADEVVAYSERTLGVRAGQTTADGAITLRSTPECLGGCGGAPMMQVDHRFEENLTRERIDAIFQRLRSEPAPHEAVKPPAPPTGASGAERAMRAFEASDGDRKRARTKARRTQK
jgi:NADH-quinone oxidoreductase subunit E